MINYSAHNRCGSGRVSLPARSRPRRAVIFSAAFGACLATAIAASANQKLPTPIPPAAAPTPPAAAPTASAPASEVQVKPVARDEQIESRLSRILEVTKLFSQPKVQVQDGVVFLSGETKLAADKKWAGDLAQSTQDVVAVVNHIKVIEPSAWNFSPATATLQDMQRGLIRSIPFLISGAVILMFAFAAALVTTRWTRRGLTQRVPAALLRDVLARAAGFVVLLFGIYVTLRIANLTHLALTIIGGTGLLGLLIGMALGNITENFLASISLSLQRPFQAGDLVDIAGVLGYVQRLTTRTTVMVTLDGNEVQIPNAAVYKSVLRNFSTIKNRREDFTVTVDRADLDIAQQNAIDVLKQHPAVLQEPEPSVLVDALGDKTVTLRVYFWLDGKENSWLKVRSSVMRLVLHAVEGRTVPSGRSDAAGRVASRGSAAAKTAHGRSSKGAEKAVVAQAEGSLDSEDAQIEEQAQVARPDDAENLLEPAQGTNGRTQKPQHHQ